MLGIAGSGHIECWELPIFPIFTQHDPYRLMFGTIACGEVWMWQEEGFGLGMDVMMKEGYGGGVGGGSFRPFGTPRTERDYPMTLEPLWGMADPGAKGSVQVLRSAVYAGAISSGKVDNSFYALNRKDSGDYEMIGVCETTARELSDLSAALRSRAHLSPSFVQPIVRGLSAVVDPRQPDGRPSSWITGRVWLEAAPSSMNASAAADYTCMHLVVLHGADFPAVLAVAVDHLPPQTRLLGSPSASGFVVPMTRMYRGTNPDVINLTLAPNGTATFNDIWDVQATNVYRLGCDVASLKAPPAVGELCTADCDFEESALEPWRPLMVSAA